MNGINKRERLINAAASLFHRKGIEATSLADIAKDADIPIGNVYYYFKTKEELALSALLLHRDHYVGLFRQLNETYDDPRTRLKKVIEHFDGLSEEFSRYGCPVGKIAMDTSADNSTIAEGASNVMHCFLQWSEEQFRELGHEDTAGAYAAQLLCGIQGSAVAAKALQNPGMMVQELARLAHFIDQLPNKRISLGKIGAKMSVA